MVGRIEATLGAIRKLYPQARWVRAEQCHLTLAFLGEVEAERVGRVKESMLAAVLGQQPFDLSFGGAGAFPSWEAPRVLWLGVACGGERLTALEGALRTALQERGFAREARPYHPHLTLARLAAGFLRDNDPMGVLRKELDLLAVPSDWSGTSARVERLELIESRLTRSGPVYSTISRQELG